MQTDSTSSVLYTLSQAACCKQPAPASQFKTESALRTESYSENFSAQNLCRVRVFQQRDRGKCMVAKRTRLSEEVIAPSSNGAVPLSGSGVEAEQQDGERCDCGGSLLHHTRHSATAVLCRGHCNSELCPAVRMFHSAPTAWRMALEITPSFIYHTCAFSGLDPGTAD